MWFSVAEDHSRRDDHAGIIQLMLVPPERTYKTKEDPEDLFDTRNADIRLPMLVYVFHESRTGYVLNKKAVARNALRLNLGETDSRATWKVEPIDRVAIGEAIKVGCRVGGDVFLKNEVIAKDRLFQCRDVPVPIHFPVGLLCSPRVIPLFLANSLFSHSMRTFNPPSSHNGYTKHAGTA
nr:cellulose synthase-like protein D5 [Tanacetum cinerariifolium]